MDRKVHCGQHGACLPAFICRHLISGVKLGFYGANCPNPDAPADGGFEQCQNGWCQKCEHERIRCGGWTDESEAFAEVTMICERCFEKFRERNTTGDEVA